MVWPIQGPGLQTISASLCVSFPSLELLWTLHPPPMPGSPVPHLNGRFFFSSDPVAPGSNLETLKLLSTFSSIRFSEPIVPMSQAKSQRDGLGQDALSVSLLGCRRDGDAGGTVAPFGPPYRSLYYDA